MQLPPQAVEALKSGQKITAIKIVREATSMGLKEAKETVEHFLAQHPEINTQLKSSNSASLPGLTTLITFLCIAVIIYFLFIAS